MKIVYQYCILVVLLLTAFRGIPQNNSRNLRSNDNPASGNSQVILSPAGGASMNFDSLTDFSLSFGPWITFDLDKQPTYTIQGHVFPHNGDTMSYLVFNPAGVVPTMASDTAIQPHSGSKFGACFSATTPPNNDWFISPRIQLKFNGSFSFWAKSYTNAYGLEKFRVAVSVTDSNPSSFTYISGTGPLEAPVTWVKEMFDLSAYNQQKVYVAIQCVSSDAFIFMIDDLAVDPGTDSTGLPSTLSQDFESLADFTLAFDPWKTIDVRGGATWGIQGSSFPNSGQPMAWINFVPSLASPPPVNMTTHSGLKMAVCFSSMPPNSPNDKWLISPKMHLGVEGKLSLWVQTYNVTYGLEKYNIGVSTGGSGPSDFTIIAGSETAPVDWTRKEYDLSAYAGQDVYIGIENVSNNQFIMLVDDILITSTVGINEQDSRKELTLYPNPASDRVVLNTTFAPGNTAAVSLVNVLGMEVKKYLLPSSAGRIDLDLSGIAPGTYMVVYSDNERKCVVKLIIN